LEYYRSWYVVALVSALTVALIGVFQLYFPGDHFIARIAPYYYEEPLGLGIAFLSIIYGDYLKRKSKYDAALFGENQGNTVVSSAIPKDPANKN
jgi:hypothetical protein